MSASRHPSVARIGRLAAELGPLATEVVFIGGAIAPLLQVEPPFGAPRPTRDVDAVILLSGYGAMGELAERLRGLGFRQEPAAGGHLHRWLSRAGDLLDLGPAGEYPGASGQKWDRLAIETCVTSDVGGGCVIRHASAPMFLVLKLAAYADRGIGDPFASHDLEDVLALLASRPGLVAEVKAAAPDAREYIRESMAGLIARRDVEDLLAGHLNNAQEPVLVAGEVRAAMERLAAR